MDEEEVVRDIYDSPWKQLIEDYFEPLMRLLFPDIHADIDWSRKPVFLDKELAAIQSDHIQGDKHVDKLVKVWTISAGEVWLLIHIEVQVSRDHMLPKRMFIYYYRLYDKYDRRIISLAILGDSDTGWKPTRFVAEEHGCRLGLAFPIAKLTDYRDRLEELEQSDNPFAMAVAIHLASLDTKKDVDRRAFFKKRLLKALLTKGWQGDAIRGLFRFMDFVLALPSRLDRKLEEEVRIEVGGGEAVRYVDYFERKYTNLGRLETLRDMLRVRFGDLPPWADERLNKADTDHLQRWTSAFVTETTLEDILST